MDELKIPNHVAIILDGNGRWAKAKGMPRSYGHVQGARTVEDICEIAYNMGIQYLTVYAFSTENWNRPQDEVDTLMKLLRNYMKNCIKRDTKNNMCVRVIGDKTRLDRDIQDKIAVCSGYLLRGICSSSFTDRRSVSSAYTRRAVLSSRFFQF